MCPATYRPQPGIRRFWKNENAVSRAAKRPFPALKKLGNVWKTWVNERQSVVGRQTRFDRRLRKTIGATSPRGTSGGEAMARSMAPCVSPRLRNAQPNPKPVRTETPRRRVAISATPAGHPVPAIPILPAGLRWHFQKEPSKSGWYHPKEPVPSEGAKKWVVPSEGAEGTVRNWVAPSAEAVRNWVAPSAEAVRWRTHDRKRRRKRSTGWQGRIGVA